MEPTIFDKIHEVDLQKTMEKSYIDYAMSVIAARALPDARDGLKPVQRRVLYSMIELNNGPDKPHRKCARIVGDTMGKYHPHGDSSIYGALVNMAQEWSMRYILVDGHGNFGSEDGDGAAAMRYTEARLSKISMEMMADINKDTVNFIPNFDDTEKEPVVLPSRFPNLLVNGTTGIAVGMATNIPPHNLREVNAAVVKIIDNRVEEDRDTTIEELMEIVKGPDFPTGAKILGTRAIEEVYRTGRGKIKVRSVADIEPMENGKSRIVVTEIPYLVNKANVVKKIADLSKEKKIDGITDLRDESDREGIRVVVELRRDVNPQVVLNQLYKHTQLQDSFGCIMLALVDGQPKVMNLLEMLQVYLKHQEDVVTRRTKYELNKAQERAHILEGLLIALDHIEEVIKIIRASASTADAKANLIARFGLSEAQAQAIVDMRLRALTGLEREKIENEYKELQIRIAQLQAILADEKKLLGVIKEEINVITEKYGDDRRTIIDIDEDEIDMEDMIPNDETVITLTKLGYVKRMSLTNFHAQNRGGRGIKGTQTIEDDYVQQMMMTTNHNILLLFTNLGRVYKIKSYQIPEASRMARGTAVVNIVPLQGGEKVTNIITTENMENGKDLILATKNGVIKKTPLSDYANIRKTGIIAITMREGDELIGANITDSEHDIFMFTKNGMSIRFHEKDVRPTGRSSMGVGGINLSEGDEVVSMQIDHGTDKLLFIAENGIGKKTDISEFGSQQRNGKGIKCYKINEKTGCLVGAQIVSEEMQLMIITTEGVVIRTDIDTISTLGRITSGVKLMNLTKEGEKVAGFTIVSKSGEEDEINQDTPEGEEALSEVVFETLEAAEPEIQEADHSES